MVMKEQTNKRGLLKLGDELSRYEMKNARGGYGGGGGGGPVVYTVCTEGTFEGGSCQTSLCWPYGNGGYFEYCYNG
jgi:hypothetical protein